jgi:hypothetical protein
MISILLQIDSTTTSQVDSMPLDINDSFIDSIWFWSAIVISLFIIVLFALYKIMTKPKNFIEVPKDWKQGGAYRPEFDNVFKGLSGEAKELYDILIRKCHPDRFVGDELKQSIATELSSELTKNKHNHSSLEELKKRAEEMLNVTF